MKAPVPIIVNESGKLKISGSPTGGITGMLTENSAPPPPPQLGPSSKPPTSTSRVRHFINLHLHRGIQGTPERIRPYGSRRRGRRPASPGPLFRPSLSRGRKFLWRKNPMGDRSTDL